MRSPNQKLTLRGIQRQTPQRDHILKIMEAASGPLSATEIYHLARQNRPDMGLATIYRTLKILQQEETVRSVNLPDGIARFEKSGMGKHHFKCRICQKIWTIKYSSLRSSNGPRLEGGFIIEDHDSTYYGRCSKCITVQPL